MMESKTPTVAELAKHLRDETMTRPLTRLTAIALEMLEARAKVAEATIARVRALATVKWPTDRDGYPPHEQGQIANATVKLCENELLEALEHRTGVK
jgi:hypothetical protein